ESDEGSARQAEEEGRGDRAHHGDHDRPQGKTRAYQPKRKGQRRGETEAEVVRIRLCGRRYETLPVEVRLQPDHSEHSGRYNKHPGDPLLELPIASDLRDDEEDGDEAGIPRRGGDGLIQMAR